MKKTIKSLICAASAAVICAAPIAPTFAGLSPVTGITAEAAGFYTNNGSSITLNPSLIDVKSDVFKNTTMTSLGTRKTFTMSGLQTFQIQHVEFDVTSTSPSTIENDLKNATISVTSCIDKSKTASSYTNSGYYYLSYKSNGKNKSSYHCTCEFVPYGKSYTAKIELDSRFSISNLKVSGKASEYYWVEATPKNSSGEKVYAVFPKSGKFSEKDKNETVTINKSSIEEWAKNYCLLANSLKELTGFAKDTIYIFPTDYIPKQYITKPNGGYTTGSFPDHMRTKNGSWVQGTDEYSKYSLIWFGQNGVTTTGQLIYNNIQNKNRTNVMNKDLIHEFGHVYKGFTNDNWDINYNFNGMPGTGDELHATTRALTAMYYCDPLKNYWVKLSPTMNVRISVVFDEQADISNHLFSRIMVRKFGFEKLKAFYKASNANMWAGGKNLAFANRMTVELGFDKSPYNVKKILNTQLI